MNDWPTRTIAALDADTYHAMPGVSPSRAKSALVSALAYKAACDQSREPTDAMNLGTACHMAVLEPDMIPVKCVLWEGGDRKGKTWEAFKTANASKLILTQKQYSTVLSVRDRCRNHPAIKRILSQQGQIELSMQWTEHVDGGPMPCRGRVDFIADRLYDLKTTHDIGDRAITRTVVDLNYHMQVAAYQSGYASITGELLTPVFIFAQTVAPFDARVMVMQPDEIRRGRELWIEALETIQRAEQSGTYPGIDESESPLILPEWALDNGETLELTLDGESVGM